MPTDVSGWHHIHVLESTSKKSANRIKEITRYKEHGVAERFHSSVLPNSRVVRNSISPAQPNLQTTYPREIATISATSVWKFPAVIPRLESGLSSSTTNERGLDHMRLEQVACCCTVDWQCHVP